MKMKKSKTVCGAKTAWKKYHTYRNRADKDLRELADFANWEFGYSHLADEEEK